MKRKASRIALSVFEQTLASYQQTWNLILFLFYLFFMERSEKISDENIVASECVNQQDFYPLVFYSAFRRF